LTWSFSGPGQIVFGEGSVRELGPRACALGDRAFVVTGKDASRAASALDSMRGAGIEAAVFPANGEPTFDMLRTALAEARSFAKKARSGGAATQGVETPGPSSAAGLSVGSGLLVVGIGGGSALDLAKGVGILLSNPGDPLDYAEVIGAGKPFLYPSTPVIAIPTTAGTGSEATKNAVFSAPERRVKVSLRAQSMFPRLALVDPELCRGLPPLPTAYTGMDALTQVLEPFVSVKANPATDALCAAALAEVSAALRSAFRNGADKEARAAMSRVSLFGGLALGNAGLGVVHALAAPLGGRFPVPHGAACAAVLASAVRANLRALRKRAPESPAWARYAQAARLVTGKDSARPENLADALEALAAELGIPALAAWGVQENDFADITSAALASSSMKGNPIPLTAVEVEAVLKEAL